MVLMFLSFSLVLLGTRLFWLQFVKEEALSLRAQEQRQWSIAEREYARGDFLDRNGQSLTSEPSLCLVLFPSLVRDDAALAAGLAVFLSDGQNNTAVQLQKKITAARKDGMQPVILAEDLAGAQQEAAKEWEDKGVFVVSRLKRYKNPALAPHLLGFVGLADAREVAAGADNYCGKSGLEKIYDVYLRGCVSDSIGLLLDERGERTTDKLRRFTNNNTGGHDVQLTIDADYQRITQEALGKRNGAVVVMDVENGDVLAMASSPVFDQDKGQGDAATANAYINKALAYYPPASVFKIVLAAATFDLGFTPESDFVCPGYYTLPNGRKVSCWQEKGHGKEDIMQAFANSCNPYFINLGLSLGGDTILNYAGKFGLRRQVLLGYPLMQTKENIVFNSGVPADIANVSIGEKGVRLSPLMVAGLVSAVANGGKAVTPRLVQAVGADGQNPVLTIDAVPPQRVISEDAAAKLQQLMRYAVVYGTAKNAAEDEVPVAGKTGTSQNEGVWFAGYAPADKPLWAVAVYIEDGSSGGKDGAAVFREIISKISVLEGIE